jgi:four helix bundle protein
MEEFVYARNFKDLVVYRASYKVASRIFVLSKSFPEEERFSITSQIRRSSHSIGAQIAEAWAKRSYERHFTSKLTDADAEQMETQHWVRAAAQCGYLNETQARESIDQLEEIDRMLNGMIEKANTFCNTSRTTQEATASYRIKEDHSSCSNANGDPSLSDY